MKPHHSPDSKLSTKSTACMQSAPAGFVNLKLTQFLITSLFTQETGMAAIHRAFVSNHDNPMDT